MNHTNMVRDVVAALQETMSAPAETEVVPTEVIHAPSPPPNFDTQMANAMAAADATQQQMFQQMQTIMDTMQSIIINNGGGSSNQFGNNQQHGRWPYGCLNLEAEKVRELIPSVPLLVPLEH